jgi:hypothetical protein
MDGKVPTISWCGYFKQFVKRVLNSRRIGSLVGQNSTILQRRLYEVNERVYEEVETWA